MEKNSFNKTQSPQFFYPNLLKEENIFEINQNYNNKETKNEIISNMSYISFDNSSNLLSLNNYNDEGNLFQKIEIFSNKTENFTNKKRNLNNDLECQNKRPKGKYSLNNLLKRVKTIIFNSLLNYNNYIISKIYDNKIGNGIKMKKLVKIDSSQIKIANAKFNRVLLNTPQRKIFSLNISTKHTNFLHGHNEKLINELLNEKDEEKRKSLNNLFTKTLSECIQQLSGQKKIEGLEGLENFYEKEMIRLKENEEFKNELKNTINNYEKIYNEKKSKKSKKK